MMTDAMLELKQEFFSEAYELLGSMEDEVLILEKNIESLESVNSIFRVAHTLKGGAGALELERIAVFTHNLENLLDLVRSAKISVDGDIIDIILKSLDILRALVHTASEDREAPLGLEDKTLENIKKKIQSIEDAADKKHTEVPLSAQTHKNSPTIYSKEERADNNYKEVLIDEFGIGQSELRQIFQGLTSGRALYLVHVQLDDSNEMRSVSGIQTITAIRGVATLVAAAPFIQEIMETEFIEHLQFLVLSHEPKDRIFSKIYLSDVTKEVEVTDISNLFGEVKKVDIPIDDEDNSHLSNPLDIIPEHNFVKFAEDITQSLSEGLCVYNARILVNEDSPMRSVDSLLIITSLEEVGDIIHVFPTKKDLQTEEFFPVIDVIFSTHITSKEDIKRKIYISDFVMEMRVSEFKLKSKSSSSLTEEKQTEKKAYEIHADINSVSTENNPSGTDFPSEPSVGISINLPLEAGSSHIVDIAESTKTDPKGEQKSHLKEENETIVLSRFTSKEEARVRGIKTADTVTIAKTFLKVESTRVDSLLNLVSELVISKAALSQIASSFITESSELKFTMSDIQDLLMDIAVKNPHIDHDALRKINLYLIAVSKSWDSVDIFDSTVNQISRSINELQSGITKIRMVAIGNIFSRFPRLIRDTSKQLGKKIRLEFTGTDTELDKSIIEELSDPLMHMIRNSVDHGIELPAVRLDQGKPEEGLIALRAFHEGTTVRIEISDDGAGLDPEKILKKSVQQGLISPTQNLSKEDIYQLILLPGFSTAEKVTDLSGRGVGMDVVRRNIEELSGNLSIYSELGKGTTFTIKIPLTLSIIQALVLQVKGYFYAIPLNVISETIPLKREEIPVFEQTNVANINGDLISIINIASIFNLKETRAEKIENMNAINDMELLHTDLLDESLKILDKIKFGGADNIVKADYFNIDKSITEEETVDKYLIIVHIGNKKVGLLVDNVISEQDIVIKPLDRRYANTPGISGATVLGDGSISLIIDIIQLMDLYLSKDKMVSF